MELTTRIEIVSIYRQTEKKINIKGSNKAKQHIQAFKVKCTRNCRSGTLG